MSNIDNIQLIKQKLNINANENCKLIYVTPETANFLLSFNTNNRPISNKRVNIYAKIMEDGDWTLTNDMLTFNSLGILTNGQHRLQAIVKSNLPSDYFIAFNVDHSMGMDNGKSRTLTDNLVLFESCHPLLKNDKIIHQSIRAMLFINKGVYDAMYIPPNNIVKLLNIYEKELIDLLNAGIFFRSWRSRSSQSIILASFILAYLNKVPLDNLIRIRQVLNSGIIESNLDYPIIALRDKLYTFIGSGRQIETLRATCTQHCIQSIEKENISNNCRAGKFFYTYDFTSDLESKL